MKDNGKLLQKNFFLFCVGGTIYMLIEIFYKYFISHHKISLTMFVVGGLVFILIGSINEHYYPGMPFFRQVIIGTAIVTVVEFIAGCILNLWLHLNIWDYSNVPLNLLGQICLPFIGLWVILTAVAIMIDDHLRHIYFGEEKAHYIFKF